LNETYDDNTDKSTGKIGIIIPQLTLIHLVPAEYTLHKCTRNLSDNLVEQEIT